MHSVNRTDPPPTIELVRRRIEWRADFLAVSWTFPHSRPLSVLHAR
jgi:hypothetical protein